MNVEMGIGVGGVRLYGGMGEGCTLSGLFIGIGLCSVQTSVKIISILNKSGTLFRKQEFIAWLRITAEKYKKAHS